MNTKHIYRIVSFLCGIVALAAAAALVFIFVQRNRSQDEYSQLSEAAYLAPAPTAAAEAPQPTPKPESTTEPTPEPTPEPVTIPIDFDYLQSLNSDIIGWIVVEGTDIDYPVLYDTSTDMYYLYHNHQGTYTLDGAIFMQDYNHSDFSDFNTVLYGHNLENGAMFSQLHKFEEQDFFDTHDTIILYTNDRKLTYRIFAAYDRDDKNIMAYYDVSTPETRQAYLDEIFTHDGLFDPDVSPSEGDRILSLSTCNGYLYERYIVQGVLISDEPGVYAGD